MSCPDSSTPIPPNNLAIIGQIVVGLSSLSISQLVLVRDVVRNLHTGPQVEDGLRRVINGGNIFISSCETCGGFHNAGECSQKGMEFAGRPDSSQQILNLSGGTV